MPSGGRRGCRRRSGSLPPRLSRRAARPHNGVRPPRSESRPKRTSSCSRGVLYFWLCRWSRRENILRAEPPRDTPNTKAPLTPQPHTRAAGRLPASAPRRTPLGAGEEGGGSLRLRHRRPTRADGREDPPRPDRRRPRDQQIPEHGGQAAAARGVLRLDGTPPRGHARPRERGPSGYGLEGGHLPRPPGLPAPLPRAPRRRLRHAWLPRLRAGYVARRRRGIARKVGTGERFPTAARGDRPRAYADTLDQLPPQPHGRGGNVRVPGESGRVLQHSRHPTLL